MTTKKEKLDKLTKEVDAIRNSDAMKKAEEIINTKKDDPKGIYKQVRNLNEIAKQVSNREKDNLSKTITSSISAQNQAIAEENAAKELSLAVIKNVIKAEYPQKYDAFKDFKWDDYTHQTLDNPVFMSLADNNNLATTTIELYNNGESVQISPNMFWKNTTTILNDVSIGDNGISLDSVFNAFDFYNDGWLMSGISKLYTMEYAAVGVIQLNQNQLVPSNYTVDGQEVDGATQNIAGYQASHPVFANMPYANAGGGIGWGLFSRANQAENVWKLSVTSPRQYAQMNLQFIQLMENTKKVAIWAISTNNLFNNITNLVLDNSNTNMRDCFINSLFPNIVRMRTPTQMFNLADTVTVTNGTTSETFNFATTTDATLDAATSAVRTGTLSTPYFVDGYNTTPNFYDLKPSDIHLVVTPTTYVNMFSGMLSVLYNYSFQSWDFYVPKENIHIIYKKPSINVSYLNPQQGLSAHLEPVMMEDEWFSDENILVLTKPSDVNKWPATYGYVWNDLRAQDWAAALVKTDFLHFLIYGGVTGYAQAFWYHAKGLLTPLATSPNPKTKNITYNKQVPVVFSEMDN